MPTSDKESIFNPIVLRRLVNLWTFILYGVILGDLYFQHTWYEFLGPISAIYVAILALYTAEKEFERWHDYHVGRHPGQIYVFLWTVLVVILFSLELSGYKGYKVPSEVYTSYVVVLGILAITRKSR